MRVVFMGTPEFSIESLKFIHKNTNLVGVFTKVDKVNSRGNNIIYSPVKQYALDNNINIYQPKTLKSEETYNLLKELKPELIIVVAYGMIIPKNIIELPKYGVINVHSSILPKYRGAAPIHASIINGDERTGVSIMYIEEELDAGDVICILETPINDNDNLGTLHDRLKILGAKGLEIALDKIRNNNVNASKQDHRLATFVKPIKKEETKINFNRKSKELFNMIRGMNPFPVAYTTLNSKVLKIYDSEIYEVESSENPGKVIEINKRGFVVKTLDKALLIKEVKLEGKKKQKSIDFINGRGIKLGDELL